ncbi:MAG TPA: hypothetical protein VFL79_21480 [Terriglobia bacterium]|nr:hypothetical protein [Terriglobia bacterium]
MIKLLLPFILVPLLLPLSGLARQKPARSSASVSPKKTLFFNLGCEKKQETNPVYSPVSLSEKGMWRAYVEVDLQDSRGCLSTTRLWVARRGSPYRLVYMMPPRRTAQRNGMEILGWARNSRMLLVLAEQWQVGSDAPDTQQVLAIDAGTGMVYEPNLSELLQGHEGQQCSFRVTNAGFSSDGNVNILVRAKFSTWFDVDETLQDVPPAKRCGNFEETYSFNFATGEIKTVANIEPLVIFKKFLPNSRRK